MHVCTRSIIQTHYGDDVFDLLKTGKREPRRVNTVADRSESWNMPILAINNDTVANRDQQ